MQNIIIPMSYVPEHVVYMNCCITIKIMNMYNNQNYVLLYRTCPYVKAVINSRYLSLLSI